MTDDQFTKLFKYMEKRFDEVDKRIDAQDDKFARRFDSIDRTLDGIAKRLDTDGTEQAARNSRVERIIAWARKVSAKTGIPLEDL